MPRRTEGQKYGSEVGINNQAFQQSTVQWRNTVNKSHNNHTTVLPPPVRRRLAKIHGQFTVVSSAHRRQPPRPPDAGTTRRRAQMVAMVATARLSRLPPRQPYRLQE